MKMSTGKNINAMQKSWKRNIQQVTLLDVKTTVGFRLRAV